MVFEVGESAIYQPSSLPVTITRVYRGGEYVNVSVDSDREDSFMIHISHLKKNSSE